MREKVQRKRAIRAYDIHPLCRSSYFIAYSVCSRGIYASERLDRNRRTAGVRRRSTVLLSNPSTDVIFVRGPCQKRGRRCAVKEASIRNKTKKKFNSFSCASFDARFIRRKLTKSRFQYINRLLLQSIRLSLFLIYFFIQDDLNACPKDPICKISSLPTRSSEIMCVVYRQK